MCHAFTNTFGFLGVFFFVSFLFLFIFCGEIRSVVLMDASRVGVHSLICPQIQISQLGSKVYRNTLSFILFILFDFIQCFIKDNKIISVSLLDGTVYCDQSHLGIGLLQYFNSVPIFFFSLITQVKPLFIYTTYTRVKERVVAQELQTLFH